MFKTSDFPSLYNNLLSAASASSASSPQAMMTQAMQIWARGAHAYGTYLQAVAVAAQESNPTKMMQAHLSFWKNAASAASMPDGLGAMFGAVKPHVDATPGRPDA